MLEMNEKIEKPTFICRANISASGPHIVGSLEGRFVAKWFCLGDLKQTQKIYPINITHMCRIHISMYILRIGHGEKNTKKINTHLC